MKRIVMIAVMAVMVSAARAADIVIDCGELGSVTIPDAAVADVQAVLETQVKYETVTTIETRTNPDTGESEDVEIKTQVVVPETPKQKLVRIMRAAAVAAIVNPVQGLRQARADAAAQAAAQAEVDALPPAVAE
jgi:hypothetical protein